MTSKAFRKSKNMAVVISPLSFAHFHSLTTSSNEAIVEGFLGICKLFFSPFSLAYDFQLFMCKLPMDF